MDGGAPAIKPPRSETSKPQSATRWQTSLRTMQSARHEPQLEVIAKHLQRTAVKGRWIVALPRRLVKLLVVAASSTRTPRSKRPSLLRTGVKLGRRSDNVPLAASPLRLRGQRWFRPTPSFANPRLIM